MCRYLALFCSVNVKFCNSGICVSTSKWDSGIYVKDNIKTTTAVVL